MMGSVNTVILVGNLGSDPEVRYTSGGQAVANLRIATSERWKDNDGAPQERTTWHRVVVWGKQAESCGQYLAKGRQIYVEGSLEEREWTDKDGAKRTSVEVRAKQVVFLGDGKREEHPEPKVTRERKEYRRQPDAEPPTDDDVPF